MQGLPADLLDRPAPEGARRLALAALHELVAERKRLDDPGDTRALHDFRVALRRLRGVLRAYHGVLDDSVSPKIRRRLSRVAKLSGASRDAEVRLQWLLKRRESIGSADAPALAWVERRLRRERQASDRNLRRELERRFAAVTAELQRHLPRYRVSLDPAGGRAAIPAARELVSATLAEMVGTLRERLEAPKRVGDVNALHLARIAAKQLRYALAPLAEGRLIPAEVARRVGPAAARLSVLQGELGRIHDAHLFTRWLRGLVAERSARPANIGAHLRWLRRLLRERAALSYDTVFRPAGRRGVQSALRGIEATASEIARMPPAGEITGT